jgi:hypothetical protein
LVRGRPLGGTVKNIGKWRGLRALIGDAVEQGASAIERVHMATAARPFTILEQIPGIAEPTKGIHAIHDAVVSGTYAAVRLANQVAGQAIDRALDVVEASSGQASSGEDTAAREDSSDPDPL